MTCLIKLQLLSKMAHFHIHPEQTWVVVLLCYIVRCSIWDHHLQGQLLQFWIIMLILCCENGWKQRIGGRSKNSRGHFKNVCTSKPKLHPHRHGQDMISFQLVNGWYLSLLTEITLGFSEFDSLDTRRCFGEYFKEVNFYGKLPHIHVPWNIKIALFPKRKLRGYRRTKTRI